MGLLNQSLSGQVTEIDVGNGRLAYVRENARFDGFMLSSNARLGVTGGTWRGKMNVGSLPKSAVQTLELAADPRDWNQVAEWVRKMDAAGRPVLRSPRWTVRQALVLLPRRALA